jgi:hypothetical protein
MNKLKKFESFNEKNFNDNIIMNSKIHPNIKEELLLRFNKYDNTYQYESDFLFGFINSLIVKGYCKNVTKIEINDDDFEIPEELYYKWVVKYFSQYLSELTFNIVTESEYPLYTPDGMFDGRSLIDIYDIDDDLIITTDFNIINNIEGKLYFDEK